MLNRTAALSIALLVAASAARAWAFSPAEPPLRLLLSAEKKVLNEAARKVVKRWLENYRQRGWNTMPWKLSTSGHFVTINDTTNGSSLLVFVGKKRLVIAEENTYPNVRKALQTKWDERTQVRLPGGLLVKGSGVRTVREQAIPGGPVGSAGQAPERYSVFRILGRNFGPKASR